MLMEASTRASLLVRIRKSSDSEAWEQFIQIYQPIVFNFARRSGMQEADAADLVQEVLNEVNKSINRFEYDPSVGKFRSWLFKVAKRAGFRLRAKQQQLPFDRFSNSAQFDLFEAQDSFSMDQIWESEYRKTLFDWAAAQIKPNFNSSTWRAFWMTSVEGQSPKQVSDALGLSIGSVYVAKNRITKRLAEKIREVDDSN